MGGVVTSLFIPVVLLLVRHNIRNRSVKEEIGKRNPGDGSDDIDGKIDNNDAGIVCFSIFKRCCISQIYLLTLS